MGWEGDPPVLSSFPPGRQLKKKEGVGEKQKCCWMVESIAAGAFQWLPDDSGLCGIGVTKIRPQLRGSCGRGCRQEIPCESLQRYLLAVN